MIQERLAFDAAEREPITSGCGSRAGSGAAPSLEHLQRIDVALAFAHQHGCPELRSTTVDGMGSSGPQSITTSMRLP